jgi:hypothetical protein
LRIKRPALEKQSEGNAALEKIENFYLANELHEQALEEAAGTS